ncbi:hypothetical protein ACWIUD_11250 [Helicobacter sp. 23-1044]
MRNSKNSAIKVRESGRESNRKMRKSSASIAESKSESTLSLKTLQIKELLSSVESKREFAKLGMSASLLLCVGSAFFKSNFARNLHIASGVALVGFSIWHHSLYDKKRGEK